MNKNTKALETLDNTLAFDSRDWGQDRRDAWLYGIICGWDDAIDEICDKHGFNKQRLQTLHNNFSKLKAIENSVEEEEELKLKEFVKRTFSTGSAIIDIYEGFVIMAQNEVDLKEKQDKVKRCKGLGFYTVEGLQRAMEKEQL